jgi:ligand-binding SRPBCC domain-containing protein
MTTIVHKSRFDVTPQALFEFHLDAANLAAISPPLPRFTMQSEPKETEPGDLQEFRLSIGPLGADWKARITKLQPQPGSVSGARFLEDVQESGPFAEWRHQHQVFADEDGATLKDAVRLKLFPTPLGPLFDAIFVAPGVKLMFVYRHWKTRRLLASA